MHKMKLRVLSKFDNKTKKVTRFLGRKVYIKEECKVSLIIKQMINRRRL